MLFVLFAPSLITAAAICCPSWAASASVQQTAAGQKTAVTQGQAQKPEDETYNYQSGGRRDPFLSLVYSAQQAEKKKRAVGRPPLEQYEVSEFQLEAIVTGKGLPSYALVKLPNGKDYVLKEGETAGVNEGKVIQIAPDHIVVRETTTDLRGKRASHNIILKLRKQEG